MINNQDNLEGDPSAPERNPPLQKPHLPLSQNNKRDMATQKEFQLATSPVDGDIIEDLTELINLMVMDVTLTAPDNLGIRSIQVDEASTDNNTDCGEDIDRHGKLMPPEIGPSETGLTTVDSRTAGQLGVDRKLPQKLLCVKDEVQQTGEAKSNSQPDQAEDPSKNQQSRKIILDENFTWEDLKVPEKGGTFGSVKELKNKKGSKIFEKTLKSLKANDIIVPLKFYNCPMIPRVVALSWNGARAKIYLENAGFSWNQLMEDTSFQWHLQQPGSMKIVRGLFEGLQFLHRHGIVIRDVKPSNVCYRLDTGQVCLIDFGSSRTSQDKPDLSYEGTTLLYLPVNHIRLWLEKKHEPLTEKADVWAAAIAVLSLMKKEHPVFKYVDECTNSPEQETRGLRGDKYIWALAKLEDPLPSRFLDLPDNPVIEVVLRSCLKVDEEQRSTAHQAVSYIAGCPSGQVCPHPKQGPAPPASHGHVEASSNNEVIQGCDATGDFVLHREEMGPRPSGKSAYLFSGERYQVDVHPPSGNCLNSSFDLKASVFTSTNPKSLEEEMLGKEEPRPPDPPT
ncbi:serine/threonine protein kinase [Plakobranchus ocellatus]|uniref:non-specific serine/threonine protein kinase n=1 Tax=Plakobranchus ocellatus TaxID=259542 RepID=A0AAV4BA09_9GAST|nr:serine/threonine protein kinase [Plakobranchus ocellatus]